MRTSSSPIKTARPCGSRTSARRLTMSRMSGSPRGPASKPVRAAGHPAPAGREHHPNRRPREGAAAQAARIPCYRPRSMSPSSPIAPRPFALPSRMCNLHCCSPWRWSSWSSLSFCGNSGQLVIPSVALPLAVAGTFGVMKLAGFSLDNLSLMALTISTGFVVDDAIVMIENIVRYIEAGETPMEAALKGAKQNWVHRHFAEPSR